MLDEWRVCYALRNSIYFIFHSALIVEWDRLISAGLVILEHS